MRGDSLKMQLAARIRSSKVTLGVSYPELRAATAIPVPTTAPVSPLTGPKTTSTLIPVDVTPAKPTVTGIPCLWLDSIVNSMRQSERINTELQVGWKQGADAMARVLIEDTALDAAAPYAGTVFDGADVIVAQGREWKLVAVEPIGHSFSEPFTYAVWLRGSTK